MPVGPQPLLPQWRALSIAHEQLCCQTTDYVGRLHVTNCCRIDAPPSMGLSHRLQGCYLLQPSRNVVRFAAGGRAAPGVRRSPTMLSASARAGTVSAYRMPSGNWDKMLGMAEKNVASWTWLQKVRAVIVVPSYNGAAHCHTKRASAGHCCCHTSV